MLVFRSPDHRMIRSPDSSMLVYNKSLRKMVGIVQWQNARLWLWMSWVRPPLPTPINQSQPSTCRSRQDNFTACLSHFMVLVAPRPEFLWYPATICTCWRIVCVPIYTAFNPAERPYQFVRCNAGVRLNGNEIAAEG
jgi:hypothetical protein